MGENIEENRFGLFEAADLSQRLADPEASLPMCVETLAFVQMALSFSIEAQLVFDQPGKVVNARRRGEILDELRRMALRYCNDQAWEKDGEGQAVEPHQCPDRPSHLPRSTALEIE